MLYVCNECGEAFSDDSKAANHINKHNKEQVKEAKQRMKELDKVRED